MSTDQGLTQDQARFRDQWKESEPHRRELAAQIEPLIKDTYTEALKCLEEALPGCKEVGSAEWKLFRSLRARILTNGNNKIRSLPDVLQCFLVQQVFERDVTVVRIEGEGPFNLPPNVKLRDSEDDTA